MGGVGRDVRERYSCLASGVNLPSAEGKPESWCYGRTEERHDKDHCRCPRSLECLRLSRDDSECRIHGGGSREQRKAEYWRLEGRAGLRRGDWMGSVVYPSGHADAIPLRVGKTRALGYLPAHMNYSMQTRSVCSLHSPPHRCSPNPEEQSSGLARSRTGRSRSNGRESCKKQITKTRSNKRFHPTYDVAELVFRALK